MNDSTIAFDREDGGRLVREAWIRWAETQPNPKPSWLVPWEDLSEPDKEADRCIWEAIVAPYIDKPTSFVTMRVWLPGSVPGPHPYNLSLENPNALMFFLEALVHGSHVFPADKAFTIVAYQGVVRIGHGVYKVHFEDVGNPATWDDPEPVKFQVVSETGEICGIVSEAWHNMLEHTKMFERGAE